MKIKEVYVCRTCGGEAPRWQGQCPACGGWNCLEAAAAPARQARGRSQTPAASRAAPLAEAREEGLGAVSSGIAALDAVLGHGLTPGSAVLLGGEPGIGKSTLLLQLAGRQAALGRKAAYVSGEESLAQLKGRARRLGLLDPGLLAMASTSTEEVLGVLAADAPDLVIVDSIQTMTSPLAEGVPGSVSQVRAAAAELVDAAKKTAATLLLVGHVTKDGQLAGPKLLEHMVDTVLSLEGDRRGLTRVLRVLKNRFGPCDELLVMTMLEDGLAPVEDPSTLFLGERDETLSGAALTLAVEGHRPFAVEVQALAGKSVLGIPRRTALGLDANRLNLLLAVLEKRLSLSLGQMDIYAKLGGGLAMRDPGLDLGLLAAVLSSFYDRPLPPKAAFWGEVDLNGQIRPVPGQELRLRQAERLGYGPLFHPEACRTLADLQRSLFGR